MDNPRAFPVGAPFAADKGMTLLDYFAGQAITAFAAYGKNGHAPADLVARCAYEMAEAMLVERQKRNAK